MLRALKVVSPACLGKSIDGQSSSIHQLDTTRSQSYHLHRPHGHLRLPIMRTVD